MQKFKAKVIHGKKIGRTIGFPTANLELKINFIEDGTYKINIIYNGEIFKGVGVARESLNLFEAHIFEFEKEIYGETLEIIILEKIRDNKKFNSLDDLKSAIKHDVEIAKNSEIIGMTFGSFDVVHEGHKYFLQESKKYCDTLICVVATDYNINKLKNTNPLFSEQERKAHIEELQIADRVKIGDKTNPLKWVEYFHPKVICLGYDQVGFSKYLESFSELKIVRIGSFKENIYKSSKLKKEKK